MATAPKSVTIRTYHVGFGDCFLVTFSYGTKSERHILVDFGSTGFPKGVPKSRMMDIANDIKKRTNGKLHAVVATHRHRDHISGFATANGKGTGDVIRSLKPELVVQPWTEDPKLDPKATGPAGNGKVKKLGQGTLKQIAALGLMHEVAQQTLAARNLPRDVRQELRFLGESNIQNRSAVKNLAGMAKNSYVFCGSKSDLEKVLPGVKVDVLGPPTLKQTDTIKKQRSSDPDEFWQFQASVARLAASADSETPMLFPRHVKSRGPAFPVNARWLVYHARMTRGQQLLQIVRSLDKEMNNTSVILLFQIGNKKLLFPGDAQIENWQFALQQKKYRSLLSSVNLYKVGHHGSRNATPKSLWKLFKNAREQKTSTRLISLMSTMEGKHGNVHSHTEVPRETLVHDLQRKSDLFTTQQLQGKQFFHDTVVKF
jgi:ribonuclease BN (tRNA processing enzyme)